MMCLNKDSCYSNIFCEALVEHIYNNMTNFMDIGAQQYNRDNKYSMKLNLIIVLMKNNIYLFKFVKVHASQFIFYNIKVLNKALLTYIIERKDSHNQQKYK